jgi:uncharacterized membrane protein YqhA
MSEDFHNSSGKNNNEKSRLKFFSLLDSRNFELLRYVVLPASIFILFIGGVLFLFVLYTGLSAIGSILLVIGAGGHPSDTVTTGLVVEFLEIISDILKAVIFFIIGVGIYSIFISPLNLARPLGIASFDDLEDRVIGVVVVVMSINFLEHFIQWKNSVELLQVAGALGVVVGALAVFLRFRTCTIKQQIPHSQLETPNSENEEKPDFKK